MIVFKTSTYMCTCMCNKLTREKGPQHSISHITGTLAGTVRNQDRVGEPKMIQ